MGMPEDSIKAKMEQEGFNPAWLTMKPGKFVSPDLYKQAQAAKPKTSWRRAVTLPPKSPYKTLYGAGFLRGDVDLSGSLFVEDDYELSVPEGHTAPIPVSSVDITKMPAAKAWELKPQNNKQAPATVTKDTEPAAMSILDPRSIIGLEMKMLPFLKKHQNGGLARLLDKMDLDILPLELLEVALKSIPNPEDKKSKDI
eukprot:gene45296-56419_t